MAEQNYNILRSPKPLMDDDRGAPGFLNVLGNLNVPQGHGRNVKIKLGGK